MTPTRFGPTLLALAAYGLKGTLRDLPDRPLSETEWAQLVEQVRAERLSGMLTAAIENGHLGATDQQRSEAADLHVTAMTQVLMLENFLIDSVEMFGRSGGQVRVLKGSAVAHLDYADPALRSFVDIDLMVESDFFDTATDLLEQAGHHRYFAEIRPGYDRRFGKGVSFVSPGGLELDLHRTFAMGPYGLTVGLDDLWASEQSFDLAGHRFCALGPDERFLHACYHATLGDWPPRLQPHRDVAEMLLYGERDEDRLLAIARRWGGEAVVARAVSTAWTLFDIADVTALSAWAARYRASKRDRRRLAVYTDGDRSYLAKSLASLGALPRMRDRMALMRMMAAPDQSFLSDRERSRAGWVVQGFKRAARRPEGQR